MSISLENGQHSWMAESIGTCDDNVGEAIPMDKAYVPPS